MTSYMLLTRNGRPFKQHPGKSDGPSIFASLDGAEAINARALKGTGKAVPIVGPFDGGRLVEGYWIAE